MAQFKFMGATSAAHKRNIPHGTIVGHLQQDPRDENRYVPLVSMQDFASSVVNIRADDNVIFQNTACVDLGVLFRPFSCATRPTGIIGYTSSLPHFEVPGTGLPMGTQYDPFGISSRSGVYTPPAITNDHLNPYINQNSMEWLTYGLDYSGISLRKNPDHDMSLARGLSLTGPLVIQGWGYDIQGFPVPNADPTYNETPSVGSGEFAPNHLIDLPNHKVGTLDVRWNPYHKMWMAPGMIIDAVLSETLKSGLHGAASGAMAQVWVWNENFEEVFLPYSIRVFNSFNTQVNDGTKIKAGFNPFLGKLCVVSADCT